MRSKKFKNLIIALIILIIIVLIVLPKNSDKSFSEELSRCIGKNSVLYIQTGCSHCITQENMFGENLKHLTIIDCYETPEKCPRIRATPSWEINNQIYPGIKTPKELNNLTGCNLEI